MWKNVTPKPTHAAVHRSDRTIEHVKQLRPCAAASHFAGQLHLAMGVSLSSTLGLQLIALVVDLTDVVIHMTKSMLLRRALADGGGSPVTKGLHESISCDTRAVEQSQDVPFHSEETAARHMTSCVHPALVYNILPVTSTMSGGHHRLPLGQLCELLLSKVYTASKFEGWQSSRSSE